MVASRRFAALCVSACVASAQFVPVREHFYPPQALPVRGVGAALARCDDLNGDGVPEIAVGSAGVFVGHFDGGTPTGRVEIRDGATGAVLSTHFGPNAGESFGAALAWLGDADGDGVGDLAVGAPLSTATVGAGRVYRLLLGAGAVVAAAAPPASAQAPGYGRSLAALPDVDGDGVSDFIAGFARSPMNGNGGVTLGSVGVYSGATGALVRAHGVGVTGLPGFVSPVAAVPDVDFDGVADYAYRGTTLVHIHSGATGVLRATSNAGAAFGERTTALLGVEDRNGDGRGDLLIGAATIWGTGSFNPPCVGGVALASGQNGSALWSTPAPAGAGYFGASLVRCEDVDLDGAADVLVGAPFGASCGSSAPGAVHALSIASGAPLSAAAVGDEGDALGVVMIGAGDLDGDGAVDVVVGNPYVGEIGVVRARTRSGATPWAATSQGAVAGVGRAVAGVGDVDGDAVPDYAVGRWSASSATRPQCGDVEIRSGADGQVLRVFEGPITAGQAGASLAAADDFDGDGYGELLIGAPAFVGRTTPLGPATSGLGRAYLWSPATGALHTTLVGAAPSERFGSVLTTVGDADFDGVRDWVVAASGYAPWGSVSGATPGPVRAYSGATGALLATLGTAHKATALCDAGDWNGDGRGDVAIGAPYQNLTANGGSWGAYLDVWSPGGGAGLGSYWGLPSFGWSLAPAGDVDADGGQDLLVALPGVKQAQVLRGGTGALLRTYFLHPPSGEYGFAGSVLGVDDQDGDGLRDHFVGVYAALAGDEPRAALFSGATGVELTSEAVPPGVSFGSAVAELGDLDGDGRAEFLTAEAATITPGTFVAVPNERVRVLGRYGVPAGSTLFGARCALSGFPAPSLRAFGGAFAAGSEGFGLVALNAPPNATVCLIAGGSATSWGGASLPMPLDSVGLVGCRLFVAADLFASMPADAAGEARFAFGIPGTASLAGFTLFVQAAALGGPAPLGFSGVSEALLLAPSPP